MIGKRILYYVTCGILSLLVYACSGNRNDNFCVTYNVSLDSQKSYKLLITYKDSTDYTTLLITDKRWSKKVCLSPKDLGSLLVIAQPDESINHWETFREENISIAAQIVHDRKTITERGVRVVSATMLPSSVK